MIEIVDSYEITFSWGSMVPQYPIKSYLDFNANSDNLGRVIHNPAEVPESSDRIIALLGVQKKVIDGHDFSIPQDDRNIISIDGSGETNWIINSLSDQYGEYNYSRMRSYRARITAGFGERNIEFDPVSGEIINNLPSNKLPVGNGVIEVEGSIIDIDEYEDAVFIRTKGEGSSLYAFESDGSQRWKSDPNERRGYFFIDDGALWERTTHNRTTDRLYRFDYETGERLECVEEIDTGPW